MHDLIELGLGIHRRLNELQAKARLPAVEYVEMSFWYLVKHIGRRFRTQLQQHIPDAQPLTRGIWQGHMFSHPVLLVSVRELQVERDSMPLHLLAGVPDTAKGVIAEALKAEPALWSYYGAWIHLKEPEIWKEITQMSAKKKLPAVDYVPLIEYMEETNDVKRFMEALGAERTLAAFGAEKFLEQLPAKSRDELRRLLEQEKPSSSKSAK